MKKRLIRALKVGTAVIVILLVTVALNIGRLVHYAMTPKVTFASERPPPAPNYDQPESWSALPSRADSADVIPTGESLADPTRAAANVFYLHPTSYIASHWNAPINDAALNAATDRVATGIQANAFNGCCAVWAPRYRQANGTAFYAHTADGDQAIDLAYSDVKRAFEHFVAHGGASKPFIIAAHSQGSILAERLLIESIHNSPLRERFVAAYLIGGRVTVEGLREQAPDLQPCASPTQTQCVIAWNARGPHNVPGRFEMYRPDLRTRLCTNPLSWRSDEQFVPNTANIGGVFLETSDKTIRPHFADTQCLNGTLVIHQLEKAPRDVMSSILDHTMGAENYHPIEYQIFFMNIRRNAQQRVTAMLSQTPTP